MNNKELIYTLEDKIDEKERKLILIMQISSVILITLCIPLIGITFFECIKSLF